jgi:lipopolysaccharide export LptBFGC system permease protein LptF
MSHITSKKEYLELYSGNQTKSKKHIDALNHALDIRKFEIELYWKRAAYFWTFIAAAFAGYFLLLNFRRSKFTPPTIPLTCWPAQNI